MGLNHLALRLAVIEALAPAAQYAAASPVWPTLLGGRIGDSSFAPALVGWRGERRPFAAVYVESAKAEGYGAMMMQQDARETVTLSIEIVLPMGETDADGHPLPAPGFTDAQAEAMLDLIEAQIDAALQHARADGLLNLVALAFTKRESEPLREPDTGLPITARRVMIDMQIRQSDPLPVGQTGLARLPGPLRDVAGRLPEGSAGRALCASLVAAMIEPGTFADLEQFRVAASLAREAGSAAPPAFNKGEGGDKQASVAF